MKDMGKMYFEGEVYSSDLKVTNDIKCCVCKCKIFDHLAFDNTIGQ